MNKRLLFILTMLIAWPVFSQGDAPKEKPPERISLNFKDAQSAALELIEKDRLEVEVQSLFKLVSSYQAETTAQELARSAQDAQITFLQHIQKNLEGQLKAQKARGKQKIGLTEGLIALLLFLSGFVVASL